jgi:hypothetical protein
MLKKLAQTTKNTITKSGTKTTSFLEDNLLVVRILCIALLLYVKFSPDYILNLLDIIWVRIIIAVLVVILLYADILSASIFTLAYIVGIQESRSRKSVNALLNNKFTDLIIEEEGEIDTNNPSRYGNDNGNGYGNYKDILARKLDEDNLNYENQIGQFDITTDLKNMKGDNFRINMDQSSEKIGSMQTYNSTNAVKTDNDSFTDISKDTELLVFRNDMNQRQQALNIPGLAEKDCIIDKVYGIQHPASKTITQNIKDDTKEYNKINAFTNEQHLNDIQVNTAQGSDVEVPCGIEVIPNMWNTQGLNPSPITGFDTTACNSSKVILKPTE